MVRKAQRALGVQKENPKGDQRFWQKLGDFLGFFGGFLGIFVGISWDYLFFWGDFLGYLRINYFPFPVKGKIVGSALNPLGFGDQDPGLLFDWQGRSFRIEAASTKSKRKK